MLKAILIFISGIIETYLFTGWSITANQKKAYVSSILMLVYMTTYLFILDFAMKDNNSKLMLVIYAFSCMIGNFIRVQHEKKIK
jgi:phosphotransferase system  glucose/maltose/N-acetylglucosamine-specific IIC component